MHFVFCINVLAATSYGSRTFSFLLACTFDLLSLLLLAGYCSHPGKPKYGNVVLTHDLTTVAHYSCEEPSLIIGEAYRHCNEDGTWTGKIPQCGKIYILKQNTSN
jgi:Sushi repeat (SCR repeat)